VSREFTKPYFAKLKKFLQGEQSTNKKIFPPTDKIFAAFNACPVEKVRVVIIGQDPYHDDGQAEGLSFSVPKGYKVPSSLSNIFKELGECIEGFKKPTHGHLGSWASQGVLLVHTLTLTLPFATHGDLGWCCLHFNTLCMCAA
jgi:uracil-DNA glycosylase